MFKQFLGSKQLYFFRTFDITLPKSSFLGKPINPTEALITIDDLEIKGIKRIRGDTYSISFNLILKCKNCQKKIESESFQPKLDMGKILKKTELCPECK